MARVMIGQWENECISLSACPLYGPGSIPSHGGVFEGISPADHALPTRPELEWQRMAKSPLNDNTQPVNIEKES